MAEKAKQQYTKSGYQELLNELERRKTTDREKIREDIAVAKSYGDLSENSEYDAARTAQAENEQRIKELEALVENAVVIDETQIDSSSVSLGSVVVLYDYEEDEDVTYHIVGSNEVNPMENKISDQAPIGKSLMGKHAGEEVEVETPMGTLRFKIKDVSRKSHEQ